MAEAGKQIGTGVRQSILRLRVRAANARHHMFLNPLSGRQRAPRADLVAIAPSTDLMLRGLNLFVKFLFVGAP